MVGHAHLATIDLGCAAAHLSVALFDIADFMSCPNVAEFQSQSKLYYVDFTYFQLNVAKMYYIDGHPDQVGSLSKD
jgi:hypothetical protein